MAPGASRRISPAWQAALAIFLTALTLGPIQSLWTGPVSAGPATLPDLAVTIADSTDPVATGEKYSYTITVSNIGGSTAGTEIDPISGDPVGVNVRDNLPLGFVTNSFSASGGGVCQLAPPSPFETLTCPFAPFAPGQIETIIVSGAITPGGFPQVNSLVLVDLPISFTLESIEIGNNVDSESTDVLQPTPTPTATATVTPTAPPTLTATPTPRPPSLGGVAAYPDAPSGGNGGVVATMAVAALATLPALGGAAWWARSRAAGRW